MSHENFEWKYRQDILLGDFRKIPLYGLGTDTLNTKRDFVAPEFTNPVRRESIEPGLSNSGDTSSKENPSSGKRVVSIRDVLKNPGTESPTRVL